MESEKEDPWSLIPKDKKWYRQLKDIGLNEARSTGKLLGTGATGDVYEVIIKRDKSDTEEVVACKILHPKKSKSWDKTYEDIMHDCQCILADVKVMTEIKHKNIIHIIGALKVSDESTRFPFSMILLLMEKCDCDLYNLMKNKNIIFTEQMQKEWFRQTAEAIDYLHNGINIAHLDIKPENILVIIGVAEQWPDIISKSQFKLTDFGYATVLGKKVDTSKYIIGTSMYQAPEMKYSINPAGPSNLAKCDIYSFGLTLITSLRLANPYNIRPEVYQRQFSRDMDDLLALMLENNVEKRADIKTVLKHRWLSQS